MFVNKLMLGLKISKMNNLLIILAAFSLAFSSCSNTEELAPEVAKGTEFTVGFDMQQNGVSINSDEMPGGTAVTNDLYAVKIAKQGGDVVASGLFDSNFDMSALLVKLEHGSTYTVEATMLKDGVTLVGGSTTVGAGAPFNDQTLCADAEDWTTSPRSFADLSVNGKFEADGTCIGERWYYTGTFTADYNGTADEKTIKINLRRMSFALKFVQENMQTGYSCEVSLSSSDYDIIEPSEANFVKYVETTKETAYTFPNISDAYTAIVGGGEGVSSETCKFQYRILDESLNVVKTSIVYSLGQCKANYRYTITLDCSTNAECTVGITADDTWTNQDVTVN